MSRVLARKICEVEMTVIPVNEKYRIELDRYGWAIAQWKRLNKHPDGGRWEQIKWYARLSQACERAAELVLAESDLEGAEEVVRALSRSVARLEAAIRASGIPDSAAAAHKAA